MIAVIPCAGLGTRMGPLASELPKELLPFGNRTVLDIVIEELKKARCPSFFIILRKGKERIVDHLRTVFPGTDFHFVYQPEPLGLGHAYLQLKGKITRPFLAALPDHLVQGDIVSTMLDFYDHLESEGTGPCILKSDLRVPPEERKFSTGKNPGDDLSIRNTGRVIYPPEFLDCIDQRETDPFTKEINERIPEKTFLQRYRIRSMRVAGKVWDIGTADGYLYYLKRFQQEG